MKVTLICVGKVKEKFYRDAIKEYEKRLGAYIKLNTIEINDDQYVITLEILGKNLSSEDFAEKINNLMLSGNSDVVLVIGGSYGLSDEVKKRSNYALSFSKMTFPHQMMRVILLEQLYRAYRIITGASYHK